MSKVFYLHRTLNQKVIYGLFCDKSIARTPIMNVKPVKNLEKYLPKKPQTT